MGGATAKQQKERHHSGYMKRAPIEASSSSEAPQQGGGSTHSARTAQDRTGIRMPADHDEIAGKVAIQDAALDLLVLRGIGHAEAHVMVRSP